MAVCSASITSCFCSGLVTDPSSVTSCGRAYSFSSIEHSITRSNSISSDISEPSTSAAAPSNAALSGSLSISESDDFQWSSTSAATSGSGSVSIEVKSGNPRIPSHDSANATRLRTSGSACCFSRAASARILSASSSSSAASSAVVTMAESSGCSQRPSTQTRRLVPSRLTATRPVSLTCAVGAGTAPAPLPGNPAAAFAAAFAAGSADGRSAAGRAAHGRHATTATASTPAAHATATPVRFVMLIPSKTPRFDPSAAGRLITDQVR